MFSTLLVLCIISIAYNVPVAFKYVQVALFSLMVYVMFYMPVFVFITNEISIRFFVIYVGLNLVSGIFRQLEMASFI